MTDRPVPEIGIHKNVPFDVYKSWDAVNVSSLKPAMISWRHYLTALDYVRTPTEAMRLGSFVHASVLESSTLLSQYIVRPDFVAEIEEEFPGKYKKVRATEIYKERVEAWERSIGDRDVISAEWVDIAKKIEFAIAVNDKASEYLAKPGDSEASIVWEDWQTGILCKARLDYFQPSRQRITDLKTTASASDFEWQIKKLNYHMQAAFYVDGVMQLMGGESFEFCMIAAETQGEFGVRAAPMSERAIDQGRDLYRTKLNELARCRQDDDWPLYENPDEWNLPGQASTVTLTVQGMKVTL